MNNIIAFILTLGLLGVVHPQDLRKEFKHELILSSFLISPFHEDIIRDIGKNFEAGLGVDWVEGGSLFNTMHTYSTLNFNKLVIPNPNLDLNALEDELLAFLNFYTPTDMLNKKSGFRVNLADFLNGVVRLSIKSSEQPLNYDQLLPEEVVRKALNRIIPKSKWSLSDLDQFLMAKDAVVAIIKKSMTFKVEFVNSYRRLLKNPTAVYSEFIRSFVGRLATDPSRKFQVYSKVIRPLLVSLTSAGLDNSLEKLGFYFSQQFGLDSHKSPDIFRRVALMIIRNMASLVSPLQTPEDMALIKRARELFLSFYNTSVFPKATSEYNKFVTRVFSKMGYYFDQMLGQTDIRFDQRVLVIDCIIASRDLPDSFISVHTFKHFFQKIEELAINFSQTDLETLSSTKVLFGRSNEYLKPHYELFVDLYEATIQMVAHWKYRPEDSKRIDIWRKWSIFIDEANLQLNKRVGLTLGLLDINVATQGWTFYPITSSSNYFFYKVAFILAYIDDSIPKTISIGEFRYTDNWLIHSFMLEPSVRRLFKPLQTLLRPKSGYNYRVFSEVTIEGGTLLALTKANQAKLAFISAHKLDADDN